MTGADDAPAPVRRNPVLAPTLPTIPTRRRSRAALGMTAWAAAGTFALQSCEDCGAVQYPPRDVCRSCLSGRLVWRTEEGTGTLLATTTLHHPYELYFRERAPWRTGLVALDSGVRVVAFLSPSARQTGMRVQVVARLDPAGQAALVAHDRASDPAKDKGFPMREFSASPKGREVLVSDAASPVGQAVVEALLQAGARTVWAGRAEPWGVVPGFADLAEKDGVTVIPLDVTDEDSVRNCAGRIGGRTDIVVNTAQYHRSNSATAPSGIATARAEMEVNYLGLMRLAQAFAPGLAARGAQGPHHAVAFVNISSVFALVNAPMEASFCASLSAALSFAEGMRADFRGSGLRVVNIFPGPVDEGWNQRVLPPKIAPPSLAKAIVGALENGVEDVFPDAVARAFYAKWRADPAVLQRELAEAAP